MREYEVKPYITIPGYGLLRFKNIKEYRQDDLCI